MIRVVHVITGLQIGGAETALTRLLGSLQTPEFEHVVLVLAGEGELSHDIGQIATSLVHLGMRREAPNPLALVRLRSAMKRQRPNVIHGWMYHGNLAAGVASLGMRVPLVWGIRQSLYGLDNEKRTTRVAIQTGKLLSERPRAIVYNSCTSAGQHHELGYASSRTFVIPNGFDVDLFRPDQGARRRVRAELGVSGAAVVIGLVARWHPMKDHRGFLRAASEIARRYRETIFVLIGQGVDESNAELCRWIDEHELRGRVRLCGPRRDMTAVYPAFDIATLSSAWGDAFPNVVGEAMACGVPCVSTNVGDAQKIIGDSGIIVPMRDPEQLAAGWQRMIDLGSDARIALGRRARERIAERYTLAGMAARYRDLYRVLSGSTGGLITSRGSGTVHKREQRGTGI